MSRTSRSQGADSLASPMTVMFFLPQLGGGGAEMNAVRLAPGLLAQGAKLIYVVARGPGSYADQLPDGVEVVVLDTGAVDSSTFRLMRSVRPLAKLLDERRPNVLIPVMPSPCLTALAAVKRASHRPRVVLSIQNTLAPPRARGLHLVHRAEQWMLRRRFPEADAVVALSQGVARDLIRAVPALDGRVAIVPNVGLPLDGQVTVADAPPPPKKPSTVRLLACGRLVEQKGYPYLMEAFAEVSAEMNAELHILGTGPLLESLKQQAAALGISEKVHFLGFRKNPFTHMKAADIFVLSSLWEGFGNVIVEAMSMGAAVVSTACPHGPDEIIVDGVNGMLVPPADVGALSSALLALGRDKNRRRALAEAGKIRAQSFSSEIVAADYMKIFWNAINGFS